jgi:hypothetical protein
MCERRGKWGLTGIVQTTSHEFVHLGDESLAEAFVVRRTILQQPPRSEIRDQPLALRDPGDEEMED